MMVDLNEEELVLLIQLMVKHIDELQRKDPSNTTSFELQLDQKLYASRDKLIAEERAKRAKSSLGIQQEPQQ